MKSSLETKSLEGIVSNLRSMDTMTMPLLTQKKYALISVSETCGGVYNNTIEMKSPLSNSHIVIMIDLFSFRCIL